MAGAAEALAAIAAAFASPDDAAAALAAAGHHVVRTIGSDAPLTLLRAAGLTPVRVAPPADMPTPRADALIGPAGERKRQHRLLEWLLDPAQAATPILITRADAEQPQLFAALRELRRLGEAAPSRVAMLDLLHQPRDSSWRYNRQRLDQLGPWLQAAGGRIPDGAALREAAATDTRLLARIAAAQALRVAPEPQLSGTDMLRVIGAAAIRPPETMIGHLDAILADRAALPRRTGRRLWLAGSAAEDDHLYRAIEQDGATIVGESQDWGLPRLDAAPPQSVAEAADPARAAPLAARSPTAVARTCVDRARAAAADAIIVARLDQDEVAPWLVEPLRAIAGALRVETRALPEPTLDSRSAPPPARPKPGRSVKLLKAAADFGAYQREWFADIRRQVAGGAPFAVVNANAPQEILRALGIPFVVNQWWASIVAAKQQSGRYRRLLADHDYPTDVEAYSTQALAAAFDDDAANAPWGGLPHPDFVQAVVSSDPTPAIFEAMADAHKAQAFLYERTVDPRPAIETRWWEVMPDHWDEALEPERIDLLVDELKEVIAALETATGRHFDAERFREVMDLVNEQEELYRATRELIARTVPAPIGIVDSMPATMVPQWHRGTAWARDAARAFHDEVAARVAAGQGAVADEKVRLMWVGRGLWSDTAFYQKWEESHGAVFVWSMYLALAADGYIRRYDRGRDPLRALAARFLTMGDELRMPSWAGPWHVHEAATHQIDGAVALADADPFVIRALAAAGIPVLELGVDNFTAGPDEIAALDARVTAFIEGPASLMAERRHGKAA
jgi:benzoyl-CoA reductase/2-hydroxyglutaryl-CoA dehydratase subunit BcrC/BadD/HgdB